MAFYHKNFVCWALVEILLSLLLLMSESITCFTTLNPQSSRRVSDNNHRMIDTTKTRRIVQSSSSIRKLQMSTQPIDDTTISSSTNDNIDEQQQQGQEQVERRQPTNEIRSVAGISVTISDSFDGGNIEIVGVVPALPDDTDDIAVVVLLKIKPDPFTELEGTNHFQYFAFRSMVFPESILDYETIASNDNGGAIRVKYIIINAGDASYARGFYEYTVFSTSHFENSNSWRRNLNTQFTVDDNGGTLSWIHTHYIKTPNSQQQQQQINEGDDYYTKSNIVYFAYFPPYTYNRHLMLMEQCSLRKAVLSLGKSLEGRDIDCVIVGTGPRIAWIIHRQHPGEHMAEYYAEGLLNTLLGLDIDPSEENPNQEYITTLLQMYTFYIVPNMNPDGAIRGHLRTNAAGANLNREWCTTHYTYKDPNNPNEVKEYYYEAPTLERSPEVYYVLTKMNEIGCDIFLDIHGDEALPFNFCAQPAVPNFDERLQLLHGAFVASYSRATSDMQQQYGYPVMSQPSKILNTACKQVAYRFNCVAITLEMPFNDCYSNPDPLRGWDPERSRLLGSAVVEALYYIHPYLRDVDSTSLKQDLLPEDAYIKPTPNYPMKSAFEQQQTQEQEEIQQETNQ